MRDVVILFVHLIVTAVRLARPGGLRSVVAESVLVKHQLLILNRGRKRAPNPSTRSAFRYRSEAFHSAASPPPVGETKVSDVVSDQAWSTAWSERTP